MAPHQRRWGRRIAYKGRFHDAVRSQSGHLVTVLWHPLGVPAAAGVCALVSAPLGLASAQRSHASLLRPAPNWATDIARQDRLHSS
jgi:hypothetical protein